LIRAMLLCLRVSLQIELKKMLMCLTLVLTRVKLKNWPISQKTRKNEWLIQISFQKDNCSANSTTLLSLMTLPQVMMVVVVVVVVVAVVVASSSSLHHPLVQLLRTLQDF